MRIDRKYVLEFAKKAHSGQTRKDGKDYITHLEAVAELAWVQLPRQVHDEYLNGGRCIDFVDYIYTVAILHDTIEDTDVEYKDILREFGYTIADSVQALTRKEDETYYEFIHRIANHWCEIPKRIKLADLTHNMSDLEEGSLKDKYRFAYDVILNRL